MSDQYVISSSDEDDDIPSRDECEKRCQAFKTMTDTDTALAMFYLQERKWDLESSVNAYFDDMCKNPVNTKIISNTKTNLAEKTVPNPIIDPEPLRLRIVTWNIDGLDKQSIDSRANGVAKCILSDKPDIVFLQEVVSINLIILKDLCKDYKFIVDTRNVSDGYYVAIMLKNYITLESQKIIPFETSLMSRSILKANIIVKGLKFSLITSHLESTKEYGVERKRQLKEVFNTVCKEPKGNTILFGGDFNMRDKELAEIGGLPSDIFDLWEATGKRKEAQFTWDLQRNTNLQMPGKFQPRCRFDRLYLKHSDKQCVKPKYFELIGIQRLKSCNRFPSDHWGLMCHLDILN